MMFKMSTASLHTTSRLGLVSADEANVSVLSRSREVSVSVSSRSRTFTSPARPANCHKVSNALRTLVDREKPGFQALSKGLIVLLCAEVVRQRVSDHWALHGECSAANRG